MRKILYTRVFSEQSLHRYTLRLFTPLSRPFISIESRILRNTKNNKPPGLDGITNEILKDLSYNWTQHLLKMLQLILQ